MDLIEFLRARLDERERKATPTTVMLCGPDNVAACIGPSGTGDCNADKGEPRGRWGSWEKPGATEAEIMAHQLTHASAEQRYILADVESKRRMLDLHVANMYPPMGDLGAICNHDERAYPCITVRLLALPYSDHPDYDEAWRP